MRACRATRFNSKIMSFECYSIGLEVALPTVDRFSLRAFSVLFTLLLLYLLWLIFRPFVSPILWATLLAFMLFPANAALRRRFHGRRGSAALVLTLAVFLGVVLPMIFLGMLFAKQAGDLLGRISALTARYQIEKPQDLFRIPALDHAVRWIDAKTPLNTAEIQGWLVTTAKTGLEFALASGRTLILGALGLVVSMLLMLFILYFFFRDGDDMAAEFLGILPTDAARKAKLVTYLSQVTKAVVYGSLLTALVQGFLVGLAFGVCGLPSPVVFGVIAAIAALLPVGGTAFVWAPGALALIAEGRWGWAIALAVWGALIVGSADNLLRPYFISGRAKISTLPVFFGVLGGIAAFGPIGMFLGPVVLALALALLRFAGEEAREAALPASPG
jgi:predicted PurR-regulated permease PerM